MLTTNINAYLMGALVIFLCLSISGLECILYSVHFTYLMMNRWRVLLRHATFVINFRKKLWHKD